MAKNKSSLRKINLEGHVATRTADQPEGKIQISQINVSPDQMKREKGSDLQDKVMTKEDFLKSIGIAHRPNSHKAISAWEEYQRQNS